MKIDEEFKSLIPPLTKEEELNLEESIKKIGLMHPITVWKDTIVDGHHRYKICQKYKITPKIFKINFDNKIDAKLWILKNVVSTRNLSSFQKIEIALKCSEIQIQIKEAKDAQIEAGKKYGRGIDNEKLSLILEKAIDITKTISKDTGVGYYTVSKARQIIKKCDDPIVISKLETGETSINKVYKDISKAEQIEKAQASKDERKKLEDSLEEIGLDIQLGDFRELIKTVKDNSIDLILTDPPYPEKYLPLWKELAIEAKRVLKASGFLIAYSGQTHLPKVMKYLGDQLEYFWLAGLNHLGQKQIVFQKNVSCRMKPILIYQKLPTKKPHQFCDLIDSPAPNKELDKWQQSVEPFLTLLDRFSEPNDLVLDPFCGTGTVPLACKEKKRRCIAYEIEEKNYLISIKRCE